jgi:hypothetical protein
MTQSSFQPEKQPSALPARVAQLREELKGADPFRLANNTGATFQRSEESTGWFKLHLWGRDIHISYPEFIGRDGSTGDELPIDAQALLLYHFQTSKGIHPSGEWISFAELPDGKFYHTAYQGYTGKELERVFGNDLPRFDRAARTAGGQPEGLGDASFSFTPLPHVRLLVVYWQGDEDFPPSIKILFDSAVVNHLPTDVSAILGAMLAGKIKKAARDR